MDEIADSSPEHPDKQYGRWFQLALFSGLLFAFLGLALMSVIELSGPSEELSGHVAEAKFGEEWVGSTKHGRYIPDNRVLVRSSLGVDWWVSGRGVSDDLARFEGTVQVTRSKITGRPIRLVWGESEWQASDYVRGFVVLSIWLAVALYLVADYRSEAPRVEYSRFVRRDFLVLLPTAAVSIFATSRVFLEDTIVIVP